jgi:hypothetical protein
VSAINAWKSKTLTPTSDICVDESFSRWYGLGGKWSNIGLPHYVSIQRKVDPGCEIWTACDGHAGFLISLEIVKGKDTHSSLEYEDHHSHSTATTMRLVEPWKNSGRGVYGDSWFASVETAKALRDEFNLYFTGVVKTSHRGYPKTVLDAQRLGGQGDSFCMINTDPSTGKSMAAVVWTDRRRMSFITTQGKTTNGDHHTRTRWRNDDTDPGYGMELIQQDIAQPECVKAYYQFNDLVDRHNRRRQDDLNLEKKFEVKEWTMRVISTLIGMLTVDAYLFYKHTRVFSQEELTQKQFVRYLASEMVHNSFDNLSRATRSKGVPRTNVNDRPRINPMNGRRMVYTDKNDLFSNGKKRRRRRGTCSAHNCDRKTIWICSLCTNRTHLCNHSDYPQCAENHAYNYHS